MKNKISRYSKEFDDSIEYGVYWCSCCRDIEAHDKHTDILGELL